MKATDNSFDEFVARRSKLSLEWRIGNIYRFPFLLTNLKRFFPIKLKLRGYIFHPSTRIERNVFISSIPDISVHGKNYYTGKKKKRKKSCELWGKGREFGGRLASGRSFRVKKVAPQGVDSASTLRSPLTCRFVTSPRCTPSATFPAKFRDQPRTFDDVISRGGGGDNLRESGGANFEKGELEEAEK